MLIQDQFSIIQNLQMSHIPQTSFLVWTFLVISYIKPALDFSLLFFRSFQDLFCQIKLILWCTHKQIQCFCAHKRRFLSQQMVPVSYKYIYCESFINIIKLSNAPSKKIPTHCVIRRMDEFFRCKAMMQAMYVHYRTGGRFKNLGEHSVGQGFLMEQFVSNSVKIWGEAGERKCPYCPAGPAMSHFYLISEHS